ncbi:MAG TPA: hypothetical protein ENI08_00380 [Candidatus Dependentiae bacterium]|nr:hypothetical protein [Candidatus Dependentiae bacterium]
MAVTQKAIIDHINRCLLIDTQLDFSEVYRAYNVKDFMIAVQREIAAEVSKLVLKKLAPAIDKAMKELNFSEIESED